jgi:hypothetical protein
MPMLEEAEVTCPSCWETILLEIDLSGGSAIYTEDCSVCCRPMRVELTVTDLGFEVSVDREND